MKQTDDQKGRSRCSICKRFDSQNSNENWTVCDPPGPSIECMMSGNVLDCKNFIERNHKQGVSTSASGSRSRERRGSDDRSL